MKSPPVQTSCQAVLANFPQVGDDQPAPGRGSRGANGTGPLPRRTRGTRGAGQRGGAGVADSAQTPVAGWQHLLGVVTAVFIAPSLAIFTDLLTGWICAPGRRTITAMIAVADPAGRRAHDAYHRFVRDGPGR